MTVPTGAIPLHPEPTDDPQTLRWVAPLDRVPFAGLIDSAPGFAELHDVVSRLEAAPGSVLVTLAEGRSWRREGERIRQALIAALSHPERWVPGEGAVVLDADGVLRSVAEELLEGPIGQIAAVHGGSIQLVDARDGVVSVRMHGACRGCSAASITLHQRLERDLARRVPGFERVVDTDS